MSDNVRGTGSTQQRTNVGGEGSKPVINSSTSAFNESDRTSSRKIVNDMIRKAPVPAAVQNLAIVAVAAPLALGDVVANTSMGKAAGRRFEKALEMPWSVEKVARLTPLGNIVGGIYDRVTGANK